jgi:hypothetical protein
LCLIKCLAKFSNMPVLEDIVKEPVLDDIVDKPVDGED